MATYLTRNRIARPCTYTTVLIPQDNKIVFKENNIKHEAFMATEFKKLSWNSSHATQPSDTAASPRKFYSNQCLLMWVVKEHI
jgi:hypothetical protein